VKIDNNNNNNNNNNKNNNTNNNNNNKNNKNNNNNNKKNNNTPSISHGEDVIFEVNPKTTWLCIFYGFMTTLAYPIHIWGFMTSHPTLVIFPFSFTVLFTIWSSIQAGRTVKSIKLLPRPPTAIDDDHHDSKNGEEQQQQQQKQQKQHKQHKQQKQQQQQQKQQQENSKFYELTSYTFWGSDKKSVVNLSHVKPVLENWTKAKNLVEDQTYMSRLKSRIRQHQYEVDIFLDRQRNSIPPPKRRSTGWFQNLFGDKKATRFRVFTNGAQKTIPHLLHEFLRGPLPFLYQQQPPQQTNAKKT